MHNRKEKQSKIENIGLGETFLFLYVSAMDELINSHIFGY